MMGNKCSVQTEFSISFVLFVIPGKPISKMLPSLLVSIVAHIKRFLVARKTTTIGEKKCLSKFERLRFHATTSLFYITYTYIYMH